MPQIITQLSYKSERTYLINATFHLITDSKSSFDIADMQNITSTDLNVLHSKFRLLNKRKSC